LPEFPKVISWLQLHEPIGIIYEIQKYPAIITRLVFRQNPYLIGIAPSYLGFFLLVFGWFGYILGLLCSFIISNLLNTLKSGDILSNLLYFLWSIEFLSFFIDGIPHFYTSTTNGIFFWCLIFFTILNSLKKSLYEI
jgi:hypothetical protein